jgi:hypothetical protein
VPELKREDIRELVTVKPYRIIYIVEEDICRIVAIVDARRDFMRAIDLDEFGSNGEGEDS